MGFLDSVRRSSGSSVYNDNPMENDSDFFNREMSMDEELRRRDMNDFRQKNQFMSELSNRQPRMQQLFNPTPSRDMKAPTEGMDVVFKDNAITPFQKAGLDLKGEDTRIDRAKLGNDTRRVNLAEKMGEEKLDLEGKKHELNVEKNKNIFETKQADLQRKVDEAANKLDLADRQLALKKDDSAATVARHKAELDATNARHALEMHQKENALAEATRLHDAQIADAKKKTEQSAESETTTELNADGTKKTVKTQKGAKKRISVIGPNGQKGTIEAGDTLPKGWQASQ